MDKPQACSMSETVQVVAIDGAWAWVEAQPKSACSGCAAHKSCGNGAVVSMLQQNKTIRLKVRNDFGARLKEWIVIGWTGGSFLKTVANAYLVPSILCVLLACIGGQYSEGLSALGALCGIGIGLALNAVKTPNNKDFEIIFLHRVKEPSYE